VASGHLPRQWPTISCWKLLQQQALWLQYLLLQPWCLLLQTCHLLLQYCCLLLALWSPPLLL